MQREAKEITVTYHAPEGDSKVVEAFGHTFYDGKAETIEVEAGSDMLKKMMGNKHFEVVGGEEAPPPEQARQGHAEPGHERGDQPGHKPGRDDHDAHKDHKDHKDHKGR